MSPVPRVAAEKMRAVCAGAPMPLTSSGALEVTASFGVAELRSTPCRRAPRRAAAALLREADAALYTSKHEGRNRVTVATDADELSRRRWPHAMTAGSTDTTMIRIVTMPKLFFTIGNVAEQVAAPHEQHHPGHAARDVVSPGSAHRACARRPPRTARTCARWA